MPKENRRAAISASMMCAGLVGLKETVVALEEAEIEYLHIDVMDGSFVPNFGLGTDYIRGLRELTSIPLDIHLMVSEPERKFAFLGLQNSDTVSIHYESTFQVQRALDWLGEYGCRRFVALSPATPVSLLEEVLDHVDGINLLMVNPGFAGQAMVPSTIRKAEKLRELLKRESKDDLEIEVDGNITFENAKRLRAMGATMFVAGTSSIFRSDYLSYEDSIAKLRKSIE